MGYSKGKGAALRMLAECGIEDPTEFKVSDIAFGRGAKVMLRPLSHSDGRIVFGKKGALISISSYLDYNPRRRFVLAHELGHLEMHRESFIQHDDTEETLNYFQKGVQEKEANDFASELLMPSRKFLKKMKGTPFEPSLIRNLATQFQVSLTSTAFRCLEVGSHPLMIVFSQNGYVKYFKHSEDFSYWFKNITGLPVPKNSVAHDLFQKSLRSSRTQGEIRKSTWFSLRYDDSDTVMYEYCIPNTHNNSLLSVIWED